MTKKLKIKKNTLIENLSINALRFLAVDMINKANSGHPGIAMGSAAMIYTLFAKHLRVNNQDDKWINRDRFVLSAGHGSSILYAGLHLLGFPITINDLKNFRQLNSLTPGHPEVTITKGIDATTGPLGQGLAMALGMAIAENYLGQQYNKQSLPIIDHFTYVLCGDGCLQEGISQEMLALAGKLELNKLIVLFDSNDVQLDSSTKECVNENIKMRVISSNWNYIKVKDGNNVFEINNAINLAKASSNKPTFIEVKTIIGYGASKQGTNAVHGAPIGEEETIKAKKLLNYNYLENFYVPKEVYDHFNEFVDEKNTEYKKWENIFVKYTKQYKDDVNLLVNSCKKDFPLNWEAILNKLTIKNNDSTRNISSLVLKEINDQIPKNLLAGSADLSVSTKIKGFNGIYNKDKNGNNIMFGVREFCMGAAINGILLHSGIQSYCATFMSFSDYVKPAIRLTALMELNSGFIFSHDSIMVGEDGPTHQPIEQLTMLRAIPNNYVFKPCNYLEMVAAFKFNFINTNKCWTLITTRQDYLIPSIENLDKDKVLNSISDYGAYIISPNTCNKYITILAAGYEVALALEIKHILKNIIDIRIISVPCLNIFINLESKKQEEFIGNPTKIIVIELADGIFWNKLLNKDKDLLINIHNFGSSGKDKDILKKCGFDIESLKNTILNSKIN